MNILPKKRWHVRTKENIARVRRDEAKAAEEEKAKQDRIKLAEREARREILLHRSRGKIGSDSEFIPLKDKYYDDASSSTGHINFFKELENGTAELQQSNKEHDKEQKKEREKYEKQIGYLTYLGQDTNEALGKKSWYDVAPDRTCLEKSEINLKSKIREDPMHLIKKYTVIGKKIVDAKKNFEKVSIYNPIFHKSNLSTKRKRNYVGSNETDDGQKHKMNNHRESSHKRHQSINEISESSESDDDVEKLKKQKLEILRLERIKREREERRRTEELFAKLNGKNETPKETTFKPKYNSQFNPELAKQNYTKNK